jgi:hypothetical protein
MDECGVEKHIQILIQIIQTEAPERWLECYHDQTKRSRRDYYHCLPLAKELATTMTTQVRIRRGGNCPSVALAVANGGLTNE